MNYNTTVINLWGGPGVGKSSLSAELYYLLKQSRISSELVREYVKDWAWEGRQIGPYDQPQIVGKQISAEASKYGKVAVIITDSPMMLSAFYQDYYRGNEYISTMIKGHMSVARSNGVKYLDFLIPRTVAYDAEGRYETEAQALALDAALLDYLHRHEINYETLPTSTYTRVSRLRSAAKI